MAARMHEKPYFVGFCLVLEHEDVKAPLHFLCPTLTDAGLMQGTCKAVLELEAPPQRVVLHEFLLGHGFNLRSIKTAGCIA